MEDLIEFSPGAYLDSPTARKRHSAKVASLLREMLAHAGTCSVDEGFDLYDRLASLSALVEPHRRADCWAAAHQIAKSIDAAIGFPELAAYASDQLVRAEFARRGHYVAMQLFGGSRGE